MLTGPEGEKCRADVVGCAVTVMQMATGEIEEAGQKYPGKRKSGKAGGRARAKSLNKENRTEIAHRGTAARWE